jgi:tryptophan 2,3-dioxygenase
MVQELHAWLGKPEARTFPYDAVVAEYNRSGKHFVSAELLDALVMSRRMLPDLSAGDHDTTLLRRFLDVALDKRDNRYDYPSYTALALLPIPSVDDDPTDPPVSALERRDRLVVRLIGDAVRFELAVTDGSSQILPQMRPDTRTVEKRCRLALHVVMPALHRLGLVNWVTSEDPQANARELFRAVEQTSEPKDRRELQLSMLPVFTSHDEHLFIRVLQLFETTFALMAVQLVGAVRAVRAGDSAQAVSRLGVAEQALRESSPLFSLLATMQVEAFRTFREFTDGASAIQSRNYKILESLCRKPDPERLNSPAYTSTPEVRSRVLAGTQTLDESFAAACANGLVSGAARQELEEAMNAFSATLLRWRHTHYRVAVRMLGDRGGTGRTAGTPYLRSVRTIDVFRTIPNSGSGDYREAS